MKQQNQKQHDQERAALRGRLAELAPHATPSYLEIMVAHLDTDGVRASKPSVGVEPDDSVTQENGTAVDLPRRLAELAEHASIRVLRVMVLWLEATVTLPLEHYADALAKARECESAELCGPRA